MDLGGELGLDLRDLAAIDPLDEATVAAAQRISGVSLRDARIYTARTRLGRDDLELRVAVVPLAGSGKLAVAVDTAGAMRASALWDATVFENDDDGAWETFCLQFQGRPQTITAAEALDPDAVERYWSELQADGSPEAAAARTLYEHRRVMAASSRYLRAAMRRTARGENPPPSWFRAWKGVFEEAARLSEPLSAIIGERAGERHRELAEEAAVRIENVAYASESEQPRTLRSLVSGEFYKNACAACHSTPSDRLGGDEIHDGLRRRFAELGVRRDVARVGWDLWGVPHQEQASQQVADAFKAAFVLLGETPAHTD
jgi:hypothetical protein